MNKIPFVNLFSQSSTGLSINGNDLIITVVNKKLVKYSHETFKIEDFMLKDTLQLKHALIQKKNFVGETILSLPRELAIIRETSCPYSNLKELREALRYQLDSFIPFSNEDVYFDIHSLSQNRHDTKVLIVAIKKTELDNQIKSRHTDEILLIHVTNGFLPDEYKTRYQLLDENSESYGAALYGLAEYPCYLSLVKLHRKRLNPQIILICFLIGFLIFFSLDRKSVV